MTIKVGDRIPPAEFFVMTPEGRKKIKSSEIFAGRKVVLFAVPGAFTGTDYSIEENGVPIVTPLQKKAARDEPLGRRPEGGRGPCERGGSRRTPAPRPHGDEVVAQLKEDTERYAALVAEHGLTAEEFERLVTMLGREPTFTELGIVSALAVNDHLSFNDLKKLLKTTDGNLSVHARKLEDAEYITCTKSFEGRVPRTEFRLTAAGRRALERYLDHMEALIRATRG